MKFSVKQVQTIFRRWARGAAIAGMDVRAAEIEFSKAIRDYTYEHLDPPTPETYPGKSMKELYAIFNQGEKTHEQN